MKYEDDCFIMFGKESAGIPEEILRDNQETCVRIPMLGETRSLNLSNSVAIILYEAFRQHDFAHLKLGGICASMTGNSKKDLELFFKHAPGLRFL